MTKIEWTDQTWNPVTGCTRVSPGCANCYIERTPPMRIKGRKFRRVGNTSTTGVQLHPERLEQPLKWKKPRRVFVNSMSDLFHEDVPFEFIASVWDTMFDSLIKRLGHIYQILTKRPERMLEFAKWMKEVQFRRIDYENIWLGVSVENQYWADRRIPLLLQTPAAVRFLSCEPLLGPVELNLVVDWVIVGGESGPRARPMHPDWVRRIRDDCLEAGVPFFFKQWGAWCPFTTLCETGWEEAPPEQRWMYERMVGPSGEYIGRPSVQPIHAFDALTSVAKARYGKGNAGAVLDGRVWREMPSETIPVTAAR